MPVAGHVSPPLKPLRVAPIVAARFHIIHSLTQPESQTKEIISANNPKNENSRKHH